MYDCGKVSTNLHYAINLESLGFNSFHTSCGFKLMGHFLQSAHSPPDIMIAPVDWTVVTSRILSSCLEQLKPADIEKANKEVGKKVQFTTALQNVLDVKDRQEIVQQIILKSLSEVIGTPHRSSDMDPSIF
jgi:hypothetical protein